MGVFLYDVHSGSMTCNYYKVLVGRVTKLVKFREVLNGCEEEPVEGRHYDNNINLKERHRRYSEIVMSAPRMTVEYDVNFRRDVKRFEKQLGCSSTFRGNKNGERLRFVNQFGLKSWRGLDGYQKARHCPKGCHACVGLQELVEVTGEIVQESEPKVRDGISLVEDLFTAVKLSGFDEKFPISLEKSVESISLVKSKLVEIKSNSTESLKACIANVPNSAEKELQNVFANNLSFATYDKLRKNSGLVTTAESREIQEKQHKKKSPIGQLESYTFNRQGVLEYLEGLSHGSQVNWSDLARKHGLTVSNGGQIVKSFAESSGIETAGFNLQKTVSGRDVQSRVRRYRRYLQQGIRSPMAPKVQDLKSELEKQKESGKIQLGKQIVPKVFVEKKVTSDGKLANRHYSVSGRLVNLSSILKKELQRQVDKGLLAVANEAVVHFKLWHDHGEICGHSHLVSSVTVLYDSTIHTAGSQRLVEKPVLYIMGRSGASVQDQLKYCMDRCEDLENLKANPITLTNKTEGEVKVVCIPRFCCVDSPARAFEMGQQVGGNFRCPGGVHAADHYDLSVALGCGHRTLSEVAEVIERGTLHTRKQGIILNLNDLSKDELEKEVRDRKLHPGSTSYYTCNRNVLQDLLVAELKGIQRYPALLQFRNQFSLESMNCQRYEVCNLEFMHDFVNVFSHLIDELPCHFSTLDLKAFFEAAKGDKPKLRAVDARQMAIKLFLYLDSLEYCPVELKRLSQYLVEISEIGYSLEERRCPRQVLRFHNLTFCFAMLVEEIVSSSPRKVTSMYGIHFHNIVTHAPVVHRIVAIRSLLAEQDESLIYKLKKITDSTSNRRPESVIENAITRLSVIQNDDNIVTPDDSIISKDARQFRRAGNCVIPRKWMNENTACVAAHFQKIADFLAKDWWQWRGQDVVFKDGQYENESGDMVRACLALTFDMVFNTVHVFQLKLK